MQLSGSRAKKVAERRTRRARAGSGSGRAETRQRAKPPAYKLSVKCDLSAVTEFSLNAIFYSVQLLVFCIIFLCFMT